MYLWSSSTLTLAVFSCIYRSNASARWEQINASGPWQAHRNSTERLRLILNLPLVGQGQSQREKHRCCNCRYVSLSSRSTSRCVAVASHAQITSLEYGP
ncbi:hypothetical protein EDD15DRAFT_2290058 [Pisolithus albus]|nr:hypothetical protein EDD15DRAFT_2290058 [Pisolithus albus]